MHPELDTTITSLKAQVRTLQQQIRTLQANALTIEDFFAIAGGTSDSVLSYAAITGLSARSFLASENPTLADRISTITARLGVDPSSQDNPEHGVRTFLWRTPDFEFHLHAVLHPDATCRRVQVGTERRKVFRYVEEDAPIFQFTC